MEKKCVILYSGGLDSTLVTYILKEMGIEIFLFNMKTPFCPGNHSSRWRDIVVPGTNFRCYPAGEDYIKIVLNPKFKYGSGMNPCIDCKIYLFKKAKEYMQEVGASFIATGEVLNQRPMSQHRWQLKLIEKEAGVERIVLRPLSAKLLDKTLPEIEGIVDREKLFSISGRSRKIQIQLAKKYNIKDTSIGCGCLLVDKNFVERFKTFLAHFNNFELEDIELLRYGRHFYLEGTKIILGRNEEENKILESYSKPGKYLVVTPTFPGPTALCYLTAQIDVNKIVSIANNFIVAYSKKSKLIST